MKKGFLGNITGAVSGAAKATAGVAKGAVSATAGAVTYYLSKEEEKPMQIGTPFNFQHIDHGVNADFANRKKEEEIKRSEDMNVAIHLPMGAAPAQTAIVASVEPSAPPLAPPSFNDAIDRLEIGDAVYLTRHVPRMGRQLDNVEG